MQRIHIIGAGLAGLSAAVTLGAAGIPCHLISLQPSERAQSVLAEGGINVTLFRRERKLRIPTRNVERARDAGNSL